MEKGQYLSKKLKNPFKIVTRLIIMPNFKSCRLNTVAWIVADIQTNIQTHSNTLNQELIMITLLTVLQEPARHCLVPTTLLLVMTTVSKSLGVKQVPRLHLISCSGLTILSQYLSSWRCWLNVHTTNLVCIPAPHVTVHWEISTL